MIEKTYTFKKSHEKLIEILVNDNDVVIKQL